MTLAIYDAVGQRVATLLSRRPERGTYAEAWSGRDEAGRALAGGVYFYQLEAGRPHPNTQGDLAEVIGSATDLPKGSPVGRRRPTGAPSTV